MPSLLRLLALLTCVLAAGASEAGGAGMDLDVGSGGPALAGVPIEFVIFALTLLGVALFHHHTLTVALVGLATITAYKLGFTSFTGHHVPGLAGLGRHLAHEWVTLANLLGLLLGFDILAHHFSSSRVPAMLPRVLPSGWPGGFVLLILIFVLSSFLDNIAAAMIGGTVAATVFKGKLHVGYLAAIVAASNAGGSGSVVGDTTTTMMWIDGVAPTDVLHAYVAAGVALLVFGPIAAIQQHRHHPISADAEPGVRIDGARVAIVALILAAAIAANVVINVRFPSLGDVFPWVGAAVWAAIVLTAPIRRPHWNGLPAAARGALFLLSLVLCASMMPVEQLPLASWGSALGLGFVSAVFDNIPLTKLALTQGGYDWGVLAYCVGFGGSMMWFGSSAGVALSNAFSQAKSVGNWLRHGWHVILAYIIGFAVMLLTLGWQPHERHRATPGATGAGAHPMPAAAPGAPAP
jgi:Na+/H+ antiporter NhaD/arsenite permease-like protein